MDLILARYQEEDSHYLKSELFNVRFEATLNGVFQKNSTLQAKQFLQTLQNVEELKFPSLIDPGSMIALLDLQITEELTTVMNFDQSFTNGIPSN